jgi:hypothetical protein
MGPRGVVAFSELRNHVSSYLGIALIVVLGGGVSVGALVVAGLTDDVYPGYVADAKVSPIVINPGLYTSDIGDAISRFDGVRSVHTDDLLAAEVGPPSKGPLAVMRREDDYVQFRGSTDGRYLVVDRPVITAGRLAAGPDEVFVTDETREYLEAASGDRLDVGDPLQVTFWPQWLSLSELDVDLDTVDPLGVETLHISGFGRLADDVLPDDLYPRRRLIVSPDVTARYACPDTELTPDMTDADVQDAVFGGECATQFRFYSLEADGRPVTLASIRTQFDAAALALTARLPPAAKQNAGYYYFAYYRDEIDAAVRRVMQPSVAALGVFAVAAAIATLLATALAAVRMLRRTEETQRNLAAIGATAGQRVLAVSSALVLAVLVGTLGIVVVAVCASLVGPIGTVRAMASAPALAVPPPPALMALGALASALVIVVVAAATLSGRRAMRQRSHSTRPSRTLAAIDRSASPQMMVGLRATFRSAAGASASVIGCCVVTVAIVVAATVFGSNLSRVVDRPSTYGWPWDAGVITNAGFGNTDLNAVTTTLTGRPDVRDWSYFAFDPSATVDGKQVPAIYGFVGNETAALTVVNGRLPGQVGEVALGSQTARELGIAVGQTVPIGPSESTPFVGVVVGTVVLPSLGRFTVSRAGLGRGVYALLSDDLSDLATFTAIDAQPGVDVHALMDELAPDLGSWDRLDERLFVYATPVRPPEITNISDLRAAPLVVGSTLAVALMIALALSITVSVRDRARELAILRAIGFDGRDVRASVRWQACATIVIGLIAGMPIGWLVGGALWRAFANQLGVVPDATVPVGLLAVVAATGVVLTIAIAQRPAIAAGRIPPVDLLRSGPTRR